jgi:hypothetical protein
MFSNDWKDHHDYGEDMLIELYNQESYGGRVSPRNGYALGKKWLGVQVTMWKEDIQQGNLYLWELYEDEKFPHWWLDNVFREQPFKERPLGQIKPVDILKQVL